jgi:hypothetical protein
MPRGTCDLVNSPGSGSSLNTWAMIWLTDYCDYDYQMQQYSNDFILIHKYFNAFQCISTIINCWIDCNKCCNTCSCCSCNACINLLCINLCSLYDVFQHFSTLYCLKINSFQLLSKLSIVVENYKISSNRLLTFHMISGLKHLKVVEIYKHMDFDLKLS